MPEIEFHLYGDKKTLGSRINNYFHPNVKFFDYVTYSNIPSVLKNYELALMPFQDKIFARSHNLEISNYISPLKMFDYLSAGKIIIATNLEAYNHVLKNNINSFLLSNKNINDWKNLIKKVLNNPKQFNKIKTNAIITAKKYSWDNRAKFFISFVNN